MSHTNSTTNYSLPQFVSTDKPAWLTDVNPAYSAIDTAMKNNADAAAAAQGDASQALLDASAAGTAATSADAKGSGAVASIAPTFSATSTYNEGDFVMYNSLLYKCTVAVEVPGAWTGSTNWTRATIYPISAAEVTYNSITVKDELDALDNIHEVTGNTDYITGTANTIFYVKIGHLVVVSGRFQITTAKPSGQVPLFENLPIPKAHTGVGHIVPVDDSVGSGFIINDLGYLTSNNAINTGNYNVSGAYISDT